jgi:beta-exotoxin I transport system permease protein
VNAEITTLDLSFRRKSIVGYSVGMALYVFVVVALYPAFKDSTDLDKLTADNSGLSALFGITGSLTSATGWMNANAYTNFFPLIVLLLTIGYGASCIAGQEKDGHLELVLSAPFARRRVVGQKIVALSVQAFVLCAVTWLVVLTGHWFELHLDGWNLLTATLGVLLLGVDFGLLAMTVGAATGNRGVALGIAATVAAASYLVSSMAPVVSWLDPAKYVSLFYYATGNDQLAVGLSFGELAVLVGVGAALAVAAARIFESHDLTA